MTRKQWANLTPKEQLNSVIRCLGTDPDKYLGVIENSAVTKPTPDAGFLLSPDYLNDLNAMHEAEKVMNDVDVVQEYYQNLITVHEQTCDKQGNENWVIDRLLVHATAAQRAEAFVLTMGEKR